LEEGSLEQELGARELGVGKRLDSERDPSGTEVNIFFFLLFILFICLWSYAAQDMQRCSAAPQAAFASSSLCCKKEEEEEGDGSNVALAFFFFFFFVQRKKL